MNRTELQNTINAAAKTSVTLGINPTGCSVRGTPEDVQFCRVVMGRLGCVLVSTKARTAAMLPSHVAPYQIDTYEMVR